MTARHRIGVSDQRYYFRALWPRASRLLKFGEGFLVHLLLNVRSTPELVRPSKVRVHFKRLVTLLDRLIILASKVEYPGHLYVDGERKRGNPLGTFDL